MLAEEENDQGLLAEIEEDLRRAEETVEEMHLAALLKGKYDSANAILTLHAGAAARRRAIGCLCSIVCTCVMRSAGDIRCSSSTGWTETKRASRASP